MFFKPLTPLVLSLGLTLVVAPVSHAQTFERLDRLERRSFQRRIEADRRLDREWERGLRDLERRDDLLRRREAERWRRLDQEWQRAEAREARELEHRSRDDERRIRDDERRVLDEERRARAREVRARRDVRVPTPRINFRRAP